MTPSFFKILLEFTMELVKSYSYNRLILMKKDQELILNKIYASGKMLRTVHTSNHSKRTNEHIVLKFGTRLLHSMCNTTAKCGFISLS